jgi:hypothetical protein
MKKPTAPPRAPRVVNPPTSRGLRIEDAAAYSGLSPFYVEELIRSGSLPSIGGTRTGIAAHIVLKEHLDEHLDSLIEGALDRAEERKKSFRKMASAA